MLVLAPEDWVVVSTKMNDPVLDRGTPEFNEILSMSNCTEELISVFGDSKVRAWQFPES